MTTTEERLAAEMRAADMEAVRAALRLAATQVDKLADGLRSRLDDMNVEDSDAAYAALDDSVSSLVDAADTLRRNAFFAA